MKINPHYKYVATTRTGFVQQVVCNYVCNGYRFHVSGKVPAGKNPADVDEKLLGRYSIRKTDAQRYRAKLRGEANIQYIRFERDWLMLASEGEHLWKKLEGKKDSKGKSNIKNCSRGEPIEFHGYSIYLKNGLYKPVRCRRDRAVHELDNKKRVRVVIGREAFKDLKAEFMSLAKKRSADWIAAKFWHVPYEPYAPIRQQLLKILFCVNQTRKNHGLPTINTKVIRFKRTIVKPFDELTDESEEAA